MKLLTRLFVATFFLSFLPVAFCADSSPALKEASLVTDVLPWGETVTAARLEYSDEIDAAELTSTMPSQTTDTALIKYRLFADRPITAAYVNNSGKKGDVQAHGKYVFLEIGLESMDPETYRSQVTFNPVTKNRPRLAGYVVTQILPIKTRSGATIAPITKSTTSEICVGMDDYKTFTYKNDATGHTLIYHLFIPAGYEAKQSGKKNLPLVVHYPSGDFNYNDWTGKYRGALFSHHDALYWSDEDSQAQNPAFVVTVGGPADPKWSTTDFSASEMQQNYVKVIQKILADYNVDASRIYSVSLAGGSVPMWSTILANPGLFAAQISTSYDPYHAFKGEGPVDKFAVLLKSLPGWFFDGLDDPSGANVLPNDTRYKGERLRDVSALMNQKGFNIDVAYGNDGELMWNGLARGQQATKLAEDQIARAKTKKATHMVTLYIPGTLLINQHWSWDAAYANAGVRNWLFQQVNKVPYSPSK